MAREGVGAKAKRQRRAAAPLASSAAFARLRAATKLEVRDLGGLAGASHLVLHRGKLVFSFADGLADRARGLRFGADTICRLHGNSKPLVTAAFLTLVDEGKVRLSDPVSKYLPFFSDRVAVRGGATRRAKALPTLRHLLTMAAGLGYTDEESYADFMSQVKKHKIASLKDFTEGLAQHPLLFEPGSRYEYGYGTDVLGRVCEVISGERIDKFVERRLLKPLGMKDTYFIVPPHKRKRVAVLYDGGQELTEAKRRRTGKTFELKSYSNPDSAPGIMSSGGGITSYNDAGMFSTARDFARFCQMLLDGGVSSTGRRVLRASTVRSLWADGLAPYARPNGRVRGWNDCMGRAGRSYWDRVGWSLLGTHVTFDEEPRKTGPLRRAVGMFMGGGGGAYWVIDPRRRLVAISFTQCFGGRTATDGSDGHGPRANDAAPFAAAAVDGASEILAHEYGKYGPPSCNPKKLVKKLVVPVPIKD